MKIFGLQKLTLLDYPGKVACTAFTGGCNFCCPFCHNASLVVNPDATGAMEESEFLNFLQKRAKVLDGVCISGGEPLLQPDIEALMERIKKLGLSVKLDTNGSFPGLLRRLIERKLVDYVAMDIKNSKENYFKTMGTDKVPLENMEESADLLMSNVVPYEFRTTVVRELHTAEDFAAIGQWLSKESPYFLQNFVDSGDLIEENFSGYTKNEMEIFAEILRKTMDFVELRGI
ncbi:MAG: anaerobic ribonucleoside-triphosphate reductase activating protein [Acidaminococcaceae bacterium]|nr:anaerobic ribonucleoside-triphosphate reductase activating protein [Acidaminococcaceae bacterium]